MIAALVVAAALAAPLPRLDSTRRPAWLAPGARVSVAGWTTRDAVVTLRAGRRVLGSARAGRLGRFVVSGRAPAAGRYAISVATAGTRLPAGRLSVRPVSLVAGGDVTFGEGIPAFGPDYPWLRVGRALRAADIATVNLETSVSSRGTAMPGKPYTFRGPASSVQAAARLGGLDLVTVANNHSVDFGYGAFGDTLANTRAAGIRTVGGGPDLAAARAPAVLVRGGLRIAFLGYDDIEPAAFFAGPRRPGTAPAGTDTVSADVRRALRGADLVVVWFHWGIEYDTAPNERQRSLAAAALGAGATLVLGAHPHVLQPVERHGRTAIAWSLGNFVFLPGHPQAARSGLLVVSLDAGGVRSVRLRPVVSGAQPRFDGP